MSTKLEKIVVRNVGVLKAFDTPNSPKLAELTTIYGRNGRGKTTLSSILRAASLGDTDVVKGRRTLGSNEAVNVTLKFDDNTTVRYDGARWTANRAPVEVFDAAFIAENLYAGEAIELHHDRGLFSIILGREGVKLARHQEFFNSAAKRAAAVLKEAEAALTADLPTDLSREEFFALAPSPELDDEINRTEMALRGALQVDRVTALAKFEPLVAATLPRGLRDLLATTLDDIKQTARDEMAAHYQKFKFGRGAEEWIKTGLEHIHDESCPFCGKAGVDDLGMITIYEQIFGVAYQAHFDAIKRMSEAVEQQVGATVREHALRVIAANTEAMRGLAEFYRVGELPGMGDALERYGSTARALKSLLDQKRQNPLQPITAEDAISEAETAFAAANHDIAAYNERLGAVEGLIREARAAPSSPEQLNVRLANLRKRRRRTDQGVQSRINHMLTAKRRDTRAKSMRTEVQRRLKLANETAAAHYHVAVNAYLAEFGASFQISEISNSMSGNAGSVDYGLIVRGHQVGRGRGVSAVDVPTFKNTLSTGDKTTLAFAFFLAGLDRLSTLEDRVLVFDDPLSSHDTHRQAKTVAILHGLCGRAAQLIVLSHDAFFLRNVSRRCVGTDKVCYEISHDETPGSWSVARLADLDELCQSDTAQQIKKLTGYHNSRTGDPEAVAQAVRRVLETYFRSAYRCHFPATENLGGIIRLIAEGGPSHPCWEMLARLNSCNAATMNDHHGVDPDIAQERAHDPEDLATVVRDCLQLARVIA